MKPHAITKLNRYTSLPVLLDMLNRHRLVLLEHSSWEDKNDSAVMEGYRMRRGVRRLFALCFSHGDETIHHWKAFADGASGCCVQFDMNGFLALLKKHPKIRHGPVVYKTLQDIHDESIRVRAMPFTKRWPYRCEEEYRIIWEGDCEDTFYEIEFDLAIITRITISQRMPRMIYETIKDHLKSVCADPSTRVYRSSLYENRSWIRKFKKA